MKQETIEAAAAAAFAAIWASGPLPRGVDAAPTWEAQGEGTKAAYRAAAQAAVTAVGAADVAAELEMLRVADARRRIETDAVVAEAKRAVEVATEALRKVQDERDGLRVLLAVDFSA